MLSPADVGAVDPSAVIELEEVVTVFPCAVLKTSSLLPTCFKFREPAPTDVSSSARSRRSNTLPDLSFADTAFPEFDLMYGSFGFELSR
jgi:hypothetical protein